MYVCVCVNMIFSIQHTRMHTHVYVRSCKSVAPAAARRSENQRATN